MKNYVKPNIKFEKLQLSESIANDCWAEVNDVVKDVYYYLDGQRYRLMLTGNQGNGCAKAQIESIYDITGNVVTSNELLATITGAFTNANGANTKSAGFADEPS